MNSSVNDIALAQKLINFSLEINRGENILLHLVGINGIGLLQALVAESLAKGANPFVRIDDTEISRMMVENGNPDFWMHQAATEQLPLMQKMDAYIGIRASENIYETS